MPRFVILEHDHPTLHWDLLLEKGDSLRTWRLMSYPRHGEQMTAIALADHRLLYLDYEGPISGNHGSVRRWEKGTFNGDMEGQDSIKIRVEGEHLRGMLQLRHEQEDRWVAVYLDESGENKAGQGSPE